MQMQSSMSLWFGLQRTSFCPLQDTELKIVTGFQRRLGILDMLNYKKQSVDVRRNVASGYRSYDSRKLLTTTRLAAPNLSMWYNK